MATYYSVILFARQCTKDMIKEIDRWMVNNEVPEYVNFDEFDLGWCNSIRRYGEHREAFHEFLSELKKKYSIWKIQVLESREDSDTWDLIKI